MCGAFPGLNDCIEIERTTPMKKTTRKTTSSKVNKTSARAVAAPTLAVSTRSSQTQLPVRQASASPAATVTIEAKIDVGFGNNLFARGQGGGLSWEHGLPLQNIDSRTWRLIVPAREQVQFKLLINDSIWAQGEDVIATPGKTVEVTPAF